MDDRLKKALDFSNYMVTLNNQKRLLKEKYKQDLVFFFNGCTFTISKELITFIKVLVDSDNTTDVVITDDNDIPTMISDLSKFYEDIMDQYFTVTNDYYKKYDDLKKKRRVEKLVDYDPE